MSPVDPAVLPHLADLVAVMDRLRSPGGCPWDAEQTHESLVPYAIEEVFEVAEAVESGDRVNLREELGDLLLQVVFHARVAGEHPTDAFDLEDVAAGIAAKLRRRHPHVFAEVEQLDDPDEVHRRWERIKQEEKSRASVLDGVPVAMPSLARAQKMIGRVRRSGLAAGVDADGPSATTPGSDTSRDASIDLGRRLLDLVQESVDAGVDAEGALRAAVREYEGRARAVEDARRVGHGPG